MIYLNNFPNVPITCVRSPLTVSPLSLSLSGHHTTHLSRFDLSLSILIPYTDTNEACRGPSNPSPSQAPPTHLSNFLLPFVFMFPPLPTCPSSGSHVSCPRPTCDFTWATPVRYSVPYVHGSKTCTLTSHLYIYANRSSTSLIHLFSNFISVSILSKDH